MSDDDTPDPAEADDAVGILDQAAQAREDMLAAERELAEEHREWYGAMGARLNSYASLLEQMGPPLITEAGGGETEIELPVDLGLARNDALMAIYRDITRIVSTPHAAV